MNPSVRIVISIFAAIYFIPSAGIAATTEKSNLTNVSIPDNGGWVYSTISISNAPSGATISSIEVYFRCVHPYSGDLEVDLEVGTYSNSKRLWDNEGAGADNPSRTTTTSNFNGLPVNNTWYLYARDTSALDSGYIDEWTITITYSVPNPQCDIVVQGTPTISPDPVTAGNSITVSYTIRNQDAGNAGSSQTKIQIKNSSGTQITAPTFSEGSLSANSSASRSRSVTIPSGSASGTYTAYVILDNQSELDQSNTSNDYTPGVSFGVTAPVQQCDIVVQGTPTITPDPVTAGNSITVSYTIKNQDAGNAGSSQTKIQIKNSSGTQITAPTFSEGSLSANSSASRSRSVTIPSGSVAGTYTAYVILDNQSTLDQSNTTNDYTAGVNFGVAAPFQQCDIVVQGTPTISPNPVTAGNAITVTYTIKNQDFGNAGSSETKIQIKNSSGTQITAPTFSEGSLSANSSASRSRSVTIPSGSASGTYTAYVILDNQSVLDQSNTSNDYTPGVTFTVGAGQCDLVVQGSPRVSPNSVTSGQTISISYTIENRGPANAAASQTKIQIKNSSGTELTAPTFSDPGVGAGDTTNQMASITIPPGTPAGTYIAFVILDNQSTLSQISEINDYSDPVLFSVAPDSTVVNKADLAASAAPGVLQNTWNPGDTLTFTISVVNLGGEASPAVDVKVDLLDSQGHRRASTVIALAALPAGGASGSISGSISIPTDISIGAYSIRFVLDAAHVEQSNYGNDYSPSTSIVISSSTPTPSNELVHGIDVYHGTGAINWTDVSAAGTEFAYIKATEVNYPLHKNYFQANWPQATAAGVVIGAYHLGTPLLSPEWRDVSWSEGPWTVQQEAAEFVSVAGPALKPGFLPPALDIEAHYVSYVETSPGSGVYAVDPDLKAQYPPYGLVDPLQRMGAESLANWIDDWCREVERLSGVRPVIYMDKNYATALAPFLAQRYDLWVAATSDSPGAPDISSWGSWFVHQYSWTGSVQGIAGDVLSDVIRGPLEDRLIRSADLAARGRFEVENDQMSIEVTGSQNQVVPLQGSIDMINWVDIGEIPLVNGFGEIDVDFSESTPKYFLRIKP